MLALKFQYSCLIGSCVSYNVGNAEMVEKQCNRTRYQVGVSETASTCSVNQRDMSIFKTISSDSASSRVNYSSHAKQEVEKDKQVVKEFNNSKFESHDSTLKKRSSSNIRFVEDAVECRKRKRTEISQT